MHWYQADRSHHCHSAFQLLIPGVILRMRCPNPNPIASEVPTLDRSKVANTSLTAWVRIDKGVWFIVRAFVCRPDSLEQIWWLWHLRWLQICGLVRTGSPPIDLLSIWRWERIKMFGWWDMTCLAWSSTLTCCVLVRTIEGCRRRIVQVVRASDEVNV